MLSASAVRTHGGCARLRGLGRVLHETQQLGTRLRGVGSRKRLDPTYEGAPGRRSSTNGSNAAGISKGCASVKCAAAPIRAPAKYSTQTKARTPSPGGGCATLEAGWDFLRHIQSSTVSNSRCRSPVMNTVLSLASPKRVAAAFCEPMAKARSSAPQRTVTKAQIATAAADRHSATAGA